MRIAALACALLVLSACMPALVPVPPLPTGLPATVGPTATPRPSSTRVPPTDTPRPTATPRPLGIAVADGAPAALLQALERMAAAHPRSWRLPAAAGVADIRIAPEKDIAGPGQRILAEQVFAAVVPFPTLSDDIAFDELKAFWSGDPAALRGLGDGKRAPTLYVVTPTLASLSALWGPPGADAPIKLVPAAELVDDVWQAQPLGWSIVPFDELVPRWKVLRVDGQSVLDKQLDTRRYPLALRWTTQNDELSTQRFLEDWGLETLITDRDVTRMTVLAMTGVTAPSRHTMQAIEDRGGDPTWAAASVGALLSSADLTHVSNEVSFFDRCPPGDGQGGALCGKANYIDLLKAVGADVVELTGNHMNDYGRVPFSQTLQMYREAGMLTYGGGITLTAALSPTIVTANGNRIAFLGCNTVGPDPDFATGSGPGSAPCDYEKIFADMQRIRAEHLADVIVFSYQYLETQDGFYHYESTEPQRRDFKHMAEMGADIVSGSQAHQPQGFTFGKDGRFISYGLGNLFFDQMFSTGTRQGLIEQHVIYDGRHISTTLVTTLLYDYGQPRITEGYERATLLLELFGVSDW